MLNDWDQAAVLHVSISDKMKRNLIFIFTYKRKCNVDICTAAKIVKNLICEDLDVTIFGDYWFKIPILTSEKAQ